jgi:hypothetical protein
MEAEIGYERLGFSDKSAIWQQREPGSLVASLALASGCEIGRIEKSGEGGIRTLGRLSPSPVFETGPIGHSGTSPNAAKPQQLLRMLRRSSAVRV